MGTKKLIFKKSAILNSAILKKLEKDGVVKNGMTERQKDRKTERQKDKCTKLYY